MVWQLVLMFQAILDADCASPIKGQFVTVQKYAYLPDADNINEIIEIDVEVYCGPFLSSSGNIDTCLIDKPDDACTRKLWIAGKSKLFFNDYKTIMTINQYLLLLEVLSCLIQV